MTTGLPVPSGLTAGDAEWFEAQAGQKRAAAAECPGADPAWRAELAAEAAGLDALAAALRDPAARGMPAPRFGRGGEAAPPLDGDMPGRLREVAAVVSAAPGALAADATLARLGLARDAGVLDLAVDAAEGMGAASPAERMIAHQMATAHAMAMRLAAKADALAARKFLTYQPRAADAAEETKREQVASIEAARMATASARMMEATARAALVLDKMRNGNRQTVVVQHVAVGDGGRAVVAGAVAAGVTGGKGR